MIPLVVMLTFASADADDPAKEWIESHRGAVMAAVGGGVAGFLLGAGGVLAVGGVCHASGETCFGSPDAPLLGAVFVAPVVGTAVGLVGAVLAGIGGAELDEQRRGLLTAGAAPSER